MIFYVEPVANVQTVAVQGERLMPKSVRYHQRDELFRKLIGAVVVRAPRRDNRHAERITICLHDEIGRRLAR